MGSGTQSFTQAPLPQDIMKAQTKTPFQFMERPRKELLVNEFAGQPLHNLRTPAIVIDRNIFAQNCARMHEKTNDWGARFRAHLKTHKTTEGTRLQLISSVDQTHAVVVSTMMEAWEVVKAGLVSDGTVKDILYGMPVAQNKAADLSELRDQVIADGGVIRLLIDHPEQVRFLEQFESSRQQPLRWSVFVKIDGGQRRAGISPHSPSFRELLLILFASPAICLYGFYSHAGNSYSSTSPSEASSFLSSEVEAVNSAAEIALAIRPSLQSKETYEEPFVLSVGSTPTAHVASTYTRALLSKKLCGILELHAGNYPVLDLQQQSTGIIDKSHIAQRVRATVVSYYPGRGKEGEDEALIDAGAIAFSKDTGPSGGYGEVIGKTWRLERISQEHGILVRSIGGTDDLQIGTVVEIIGQHACLIAAAYPWYYIVDKDVDGGQRVVDVWVPWKGW